jgi:hypothetical protein
MAWWIHCPTFRSRLRSIHLHLLRQYGRRRRIWPARPTLQHVLLCTFHVSLASRRRSSSRTRARRGSHPRAPRVDVPGSIAPASSCERITTRSAWRIQVARHADRCRGHHHWRRRHRLHARRRAPGRHGHAHALPLQVCMCVSRCPCTLAGPSVCFSVLWRARVVEDLVYSDRRQALGWGMAEMIYLVMCWFVYYTIHRRHSQRTHTHPYEYTHANPTPRSIFEDCAGKSSRLTKSPQAPLSTETSPTTESTNVVKSWEIRSHGESNPGPEVLPGLLWPLGYRPFRGDVLILVIPGMWT